jgi:ABC-2 type transport system permease protein
MKAFLAQWRAEVRMTIRHGETLLLTIGIPVILLVFFTAVHVTSTPGTRRIDFLAPGILALCVMSTSLVALSISTGFERTYGVLRRLAVTPLGRSRLILAKIASIKVVEVIQIVVIGSVALALGWRPRGGVLSAVEFGVTVVLATAGFAGIGLALAGRLRAEINLAAANGLYLLLLLLSGFVITVSSLPSVIRSTIVVLPSGAFADALHRVLGHGTSPSASDWISLALWALAAPVLAARTFRYD